MPGSRDIDSLPHVQTKMEMPATGKVNAEPPAKCDSKVETLLDAFGWCDYSLDKFTERYGAHLLETTADSMVNDNRSCAFSGVLSPSTADLCILASLERKLGRKLRHPKNLASIEWDKAAQAEILTHPDRPLVCQHR